MAVTGASGTFISLSIVSLMVKPEGVKNSKYKIPTSK